MIAVILFQILSKRDKDIALVLSLAVCTMAAMAALAVLEPVIDFILHLQSIADLNNGMLRIVLKAVGIGILADIAGHICSDAGNKALSKVLQLVATAVILWLSLPLFTELLELLEGILGEL